jgi:hypothetical protein
MSSMMVDCFQQCGIQIILSIYDGTLFTMCNKDDSLCKRFRATIKRYGKQQRREMAPFVLWCDKKEYAAG